jgi:LmbE family N-acetylglucosaminyl deacetylase
VPEPHHYDTLFKGPGDRRLRRVLAIATTTAELDRHCSATLAVLGERAATLVVVGTGLGYRPLALPGEDELRELLVERIQAAQPDVVICPDPTPMLRQHPDVRRVARCALDAAWPYSGVVKEAWVYGGPAPDLFVDGECGEERFAQVDFRER